MKKVGRREFTRLGALALVGMRVPLGAQTVHTVQKPLGYAAIGLGTVSEIFLRACEGSKTAKITALVTGHPKEKGEKYAAKYGIPKTSIYTYETFDRIRDNKDVDAVYVGLPNSMHREFTVRAAAAGKHVLCEKPMAISSAECREMIAACQQAKVKLMIAYRIQYEPVWTRAIQLIRSGAIGKVESLQGGLWYQVVSGWRLNRKLAGGGSLLDLGIYPLNAIRTIAGEEPTGFTAVVATRERGTRFAEVEQSMEWTMKFPSGIVASCGCSYGALGPGYLQVNGANGNLRFDPAFSYDGIHLRGETHILPPAGPLSRSVDIASAAKHPYMFTLQAEHFAACVRHDVRPHSPGEEGLKDVLAIEAIYRAAGSPIA